MPRHSLARAVGLAAIACVALLEVSVARAQDDASGCRTAVARLRAVPLGQETSSVSAELGTGYVSQTSNAARAACASAGGLALADAAARAAQAAPTGTAEDARYLAGVIDETQFRAAVWLQRARTLRDTAALRAAIESLPASTRADVARLSAGPPAGAVDDETLARDLARWRYATDPASITDCIVDSDVDARRAGLIHCYSTTLPEAEEMGSVYPHTIEYFVKGPDGVRYAGSARHLPGYDCENGVVRETRTLSRLSAARDHLDGVLHVYREGADAEDYVDMTTTADVCDLAQRKCFTFQIGRRVCEADSTTGRLVCTESWEASARVQRGVLTFRRVRGVFPPATASSILTSPIDLASLAAQTNSAPPSASVDAPVATVRASAGACHAEVTDPRPPLNVRANADATSAVTGTLPNGTRVIPRDRRHGFTRVEAPVAGWIWARNLRRVCDP